MQVAAAEYQREESTPEGDWMQQFAMNQLYARMKEEPML